MRRLTPLLLLVLFLLLPPATQSLYGQSTRAARDVPAVGAQLVREGDFAAALDAALGVGTGQNEIEAENRLASLGIMPRNGWMADYPVTPDVLGELQEAVGNAAYSRKLSMSSDEALRRFGEVAYGAGLQERSYATNGTHGSEPGSVEGYPDQDVVSGYYADQGPPVVTYYAPPPDYYYLYSFVPYPFWYSTAWFPGFFVLRDFHRAYGRGFVSNHFIHATSNTIIHPTISRINATTGSPAGIPGTIRPGVSRAIAPRAGFARPAGPFAGAPGNAARSFGAPHATTASFSRTASSSSHSSFAHSSFSHSGGGFRSGGGHSGGGHSGGGHR